MKTEENVLSDDDKFYNAEIYLEKRNEQYRKFVDLLMGRFTRREQNEK